MLWASLTVLLKATLCTVGDVKELPKFVQLQIKTVNNNILKQVYNKIVKCILLSKCCLMIFE